MAAWMVEVSVDDGKPEPYRFVVVAPTLADVAEAVDGYQDPDMQATDFVEIRSVERLCDHVIDAKGVRI